MSVEQYFPFWPKLTDAQRDLLQSAVSSAVSYTHLQGHSVRFDPCVERTPGHAGVGADIGDGLAGLVAGDQRLLCFCADMHGLIPPVKWCRILRKKANWRYL